MERTLRTSRRSERVPREPMYPPQTASCHSCWAQARRRSSALRSTGRVGCWLFRTDSLFLPAPSTVKTSDSEPNYGTIERPNRVERCIGRGDKLVWVRAVAVCQEQVEA